MFTLFICIRAHLRIAERQRGKRRVDFPGMSFLPRVGLMGNVSFSLRYRYHCVEPELNFRYIVTLVKATSVGVSGEGIRHSL